MKSIYLSIILLFIYSINVKSQPGTLDSDFSADGKVSVEFSNNDDVINAMLVQADGKILVAGYSNNGNNDNMALARFTSDGSMDVSFGVSGKKVIFINSGTDRINAIILQPNQSILAAGQMFSGSYENLALVRILPDGQMDNNFSGDGIATISYSGLDENAYAIAMQNNGKILVAGYSDNGSNDDFMIVRFNRNGTLDTTFSLDGIVTTDFEGRDDRAYSIIVLPNNKILVGGYAEDDYGPRDKDFAIVLYNQDGSIDLSFGTNGKVMTDVSGSDEDYARTLTLTENGKIIQGGYTYNFLASASMTVIQYNMDGSLDTEFANNGIFRDMLGAHTAFCNATLCQVNSKILLGGYTYYEDSYDFTLVRLNPDGSYDSEFGTDGISTIDFGYQYDDYAYAMAIQDDHRILLAGYSEDGNDKDFAVARFLAGFYTATPEPQNLKKIRIFPNPANNQFNLHYSLDQESDISIIIRNMAGQIIDIPINNEFKMPGIYTEKIKLSKDYSGSLYLIEFSFNEKTVFTKLLLR